MANIENKEITSKPINKTTETLIKELETMSDTGLHDLFMFFYKLNCQHYFRECCDRVKFMI